MQALIPQGLIEDVAEPTAMFVTVCSGASSDHFGKQQGLAIFGYAAGALRNPLFAIAPDSGLIATASLLDRVSKGIRCVPCDALVVDFTVPAPRGAAFGRRQGLGTCGAFTGP